MPTPKLTVVIPCRNEALHIQELLDALERQDFRDFELVAVDGESSDGTREILREYASRHPACAVTVLTNPRRSIPAGLNLGIQHAQGEVIARLDGHSRPKSNYLGRCLAVLDESGAEVVGGAWDIQPGAPGLVARAIALAVSSPLGAGDARYRLRSTSRPQDVDTVPYGCFRRETWHTVGRYNEALLVNEDYEFNLRVRLRGGRVYFDPSLQCDYFARPTLARLGQQYWQYGWWKAMMLKQHPHSLRLRQALPMAWAGGSLILVMLSILWPCLRSGVLFVWGIYVATVLGYAGWLAWRRDLRLGPPLAAAFVLVHFSWGLGAWAGLALGRRKPDSVWE